MAETNPEDPLIGTEVGGYLLEERLGAGGMGVVYRAFDRGLHRPVALKLLAPHLTQNADARRRFQKEITSAAAVDHPNIVPVYDAGVDAGNFYIVMRLVDGPDLDSVLSQGPLPLERALRLFNQAADALQKVHNSGLVHRDVKPHNLLIWNAGAANEQALLTDFGIAKAVDSGTLMTLGVPGTPDYVAPEVAQWQPATDRSDQYSLACVLFRMLSGECPYEGMEVPRAHIHEQVPDMQERLPSVPRPVQAALARALAKKPGNRFPSVQAFADALMLDSRETPDVGTPGRSLHAELAELLAAAPGQWFLPADLAAQINEGHRTSGRDPITALQVEARVRAFPQLFRRRGDQIKLRHPGGAQAG